MNEIEKVLRLYEQNRENMVTVLTAAGGCGESLVKQYPFSEVIRTCSQNMIVLCAMYMPNYGEPVKEEEK